MEFHKKCMKMYQLCQPHTDTHTRIGALSLFWGKSAAGKPPNYCSLNIFEQNSGSETIFIKQKFVTVEYF